MIHINQLAITPDYQKLIIDACIPPVSYLENCYISDIRITNQDKYTGLKPTDETSVYIWDALKYKYPDPQDYITAKDNNEEPHYKHVRLCIPCNEVTDGLKGLFYVYITMGGVPSEECPCGEDTAVSMFTVTCIADFYAQIMNYINEIADTCNVPQDFINYFLQIKALDLAIKSGNYVDANTYYNMFFKTTDKRNPGLNKRRCNCGHNHKQYL